MKQFATAACVFIGIVGTTFLIIKSCLSEPNRIEQEMRVNLGFQQI